MKHRWFSFKNIKIASYGDYILTDISNLETGSASSRKINYIDTDGSSYRDIWYNERPFEISGFIQAFNEETMVKLKRKLIQACSLKESFRIKYFNRSDVYSAECYFDKLPTFEKRRQWYLPFKLYLTIPGFYWQSDRIHTKNILKYTDNVINEFTLPCVFTSLTQQTNVSNLGDVEAYPIFTITCEKQNEGSVIEITNTTTEQTIKLNYQTAEGEIVTIDTFNQIATSNLHGNVTGSITIDSSFPILKQGNNSFSCVSVGNMISVQYYDNYLGV